jgi:signal transduction histidine kinase
MDRAAARERLHRRFIAEEVVVGLRHKLLNKLAGVGALAFHLKRQLPPEQTAAASVLPLLEAEVAEASAALDFRFLEPAVARPDPVPLEAALTGTLRSFARARSPGVELIGPAHDPSLALIEAGELDLAVYCLLENACEALAGRGAAVRLRCHDLGGPEMMVAVEVLDQGSELPEQARDPFFSTKPGRLGLGLNVAERVAVRAGGRLELEGGAGVTARLVLPRGVQ